MTAIVLCIIRLSYLRSRRSDRCTWYILGEAQRHMHICSIVPCLHNPTCLLRVLP